MPTRTPISAGNWKMHKTTEQAVALAQAVREAGDVPGVEVVVAPSFLQLSAVADCLAGSRVGVAGQTMHADPEGAFTGEVSPVQLAEVAGWVILGHSERRQHFCETDSACNAKVQAALGHGLRPILCVGEQLAEREAGQTEEVLQRQVTRGLAHLDLPDGFVIAYEPVWAIGTGKAATEVEAQAACAYIRGLVAGVAGEAKAATVRILYGGSVKPDNAPTLAAQPDVDGALIGGASLDPAAFLAITRAIAAAKS